jgi:GNAT superfamily N-acetyltransferase
MDFSSFKFVPLTESLSLLPFECRDDDLNHFLWDDAKLYLTELMAVTYLIIDPAANKTVAYFSLLNDKVSYDVDNKSIWRRLNKNIAFRKRRKNYPSVKIGRFAVSKDYDGKGIGRILIDFIKVFFTQSNKTGCRFLTVDAYVEAVGFYQKNGFDFFTKKDEGKNTRLMFFDLKPFKDALNNKK